MSFHEGVSCDSCLRNNFRGKRYKCLICFDYDLCATCHDSGALHGRHTAEHPMQCILTRNEQELYFAGEASEQTHSFTCPLCGKLGFTDTSLFEHVNASHPSTSTEVVCPICAMLPGGEPNQITDDFQSHLNEEHRNNRELEEPHIVRIRSRHHVRGLNNNRTRRSQFLNPSGASSATSARDAIDPIAHLLSQLSDVRRVNNSNAAAAASSATVTTTTTSGSSGQNGLHFQFERQSASSNSASNRLPIERIIRRHQQSSQLSTSLASAHAEAMTNSQMPFMVLLDPTTSPSVNSKSNNTAAGSQLNRISTKYILSSYATTSPIVDSEREKLNTLRADRSIFVEEMIIASLTEPLDIDTILSTKPTSEEVKIASTSDQSLDQTNLEIKITNDDIEIKDESNADVDSNISSSNLPCEPKAHVDNLKKSGGCNDEENEMEDSSNKPSMVGSMKPSIKCSPSPMNYVGGEHESSVQQKPLPSLIGASPNSPFIMSQAPLNGPASHRSTRTSKGRSTSSISQSSGLPPNLASLAIRSSLNPRPGATITVVSPTGRRKVLKHSTEPPPN